MPEEHDELAILKKKAPTKEDEFFAREEKERIEAARREREASEAAAKESVAREAARGRCPRDGSRLKTETRDNVEIDHCLECNGVWLDGGELETLIGKNEGLLGRIFRRH